MLSVLVASLLAGLILAVPHLRVHVQTDYAAVDGSEREEDVRPVDVLGEEDLVAGSSPVGAGNVKLVHPSDDVNVVFFRVELLSESILNSLANFEAVERLVSIRVEVRDPPVARLPLRRFLRRAVSEASRVRIL